MIKSMYLNSFLVLITIIIVSLFSGCKKELISENLNIEEKQFSSQKITIQEAKLKYKQNSSVVKHSAQSRTGNFSPVDYFNLELFWDLSIFPQNFNGNILMVPIKDSALFLENWTEAFMVFYMDNANQVVQEMMIFFMDKSHYESTSGYPNVSNFSGFSFHVEIDGNASGFCYYQNGILTSYAADLLFNEDGTISNPALSAHTRMPWWDEMWVAICQFFGWGVVCPNWNGGGGSGGNFWKDAGDFFRNLAGNGEGGFDGFDGADFGAFFDGSGYGPGGRWTFGNSGNGGSDGGNNPSRNLRDYFSELQIKQFTKSVDRLNNYFNWNKSLLEYYVDFNIDADCLAEIAKLSENSIDGIESLPCLQELIKFVVSGLTLEEWEEYKEDKECKSLPENQQKVETAKLQFAQAFGNELSQLSQDLPGADLDIDLIKSIMSKVILKKTGKLIPLVGIGLDFAELRAAYLARDFLAAGLSMASIATEIIPCAMIVDLGLDAASIGNTILKANKSLGELKTFLGSNAALFEAIFKTIDDLDVTDALEWIKSGSTKQFRVILGSNSVDDFLSKIATQLGKSWKDLSWGK